MGRTSRLCVKPSQHESHLDSSRSSGPYALSQFHRPTSKDRMDVSSHIIRQSTSQPFKFFIPPENAVAYKTPPSGGNNTSMAENYYLFFKPLPVGQHTIELEVIRVPTVSTQPVEHPIAKWDINVVP